MIPQLNTSHYFSQVFWLLVCLLFLVWFFKKIIIPRMNLVMRARDTFLQKESSDVRQLEIGIDNLKKSVEDLKNQSIKTTADIINIAKAKSEETLNEQIQILKQENEEQIYSTRKRLDEELKNLNSAFKVQLEITAQNIFSQIFERDC